MIVTFDEQEITAFANRLAAMPYNQVADLIAFIQKKVDTAKQETTTNGDTNNDPSPQSDTVSSDSVSSS